ncbi:MAG: hypothetical protein JKY55_17310 [Aliivibrio sp.]|uniref:hypothetical protein n=1 Tax=Aliivibrio sp. TaxID=1872443 RepID=UPI001A518481|nr:hypothetical protein [Aliivibrio sp.]
MISDAAIDTVKNYGLRLNAAKHNEKGEILKQALSDLGWGKDKFYRTLKKLTGGTVRKVRTDAGTTSQNIESLRFLAATTKISARANDKILLKTTTAISILSQSGHDFTSPSNVNRLLRDNNLTGRQMKQDNTHGHFQSLCPNHVHMVDPSLCVLYYPPGKKGLRVQKFTTKAEQYKNKPEAVEKIKNLRVWRYVLVDHCSGLIAVKYYETPGESQMVLYDFLLWGWSKLSGSPFYGIPRNLYWDKGSANTSKAIKHALDCLRVESRTHTVHLARAKGSVEGANNLVETQFEGRLFLEPVHSVEELNIAVIAWQNAYNANLIPNYNAKNSRHGMARTDAWLKIMQSDFIQHLRALPPEDYCRYIFTHEPASRDVSGELEITFRHPVAKKSLTYSLANLDGIYAKQKVLVSPIVINEECKLLVTIENKYGDDVMHEVAPVVFNEMGFRVDSPVFGEGFDTKKDTVIDSQQKQLDRVAFPDLKDEDIVKAKAKKITPFNGEIKAISQLNNIDMPAAITPKSKSFNLPSEFVPTPAKPLSPLELKRAVIHALGRDLEAKDVEILSQFPEVFADDIGGVVTAILNAKSPVLKLVNHS